MGGLIVLFVFAKLWIFGVRNGALQQVSFDEVIVIPVNLKPYDFKGGAGNFRKIFANI